MYRHEEKFLLSEKQYHIIKNRLKVLLKPDVHGGMDNEYVIRSIYLDDHKMTSLHQKEIGIKDRYKFRIRFYNHNDQFIKLEKKIKHNCVGYKESIQVTTEEASSILSNNFNFLNNRTEMLAKELLILSKTAKLKPVIVIDYIREAYMLPFNDIRITFDKKITYSTDVSHGLDKELTMTGAIKNTVLEVKYNDFLPSYIKKVLFENITKTSISKYLLCYYHSLGEVLL